MDDNSNELKDLYATPESRTDTILDRDNATFWIALRKAMRGAGLAGAAPDEITKIALDDFGVELEIVSNEAGSGFKPEARVVDEQKYLLFILKHQS